MSTMILIPLLYLVLGLQLLPTSSESATESLSSVITRVRAQSDVFEKYSILAALQATNVDLFYSAVLAYPDEIVPVVYTPGVGAACQKYGHLPLTAPHLTLSLDQAGSIEQVLRDWPSQDIRVIVVTDGERILGLGDLGVWGAGIPVGKLSLYTALAGIHPSQTLPITIDAGTNTLRLIEDSQYTGTKRPRVRGEEYESFMDEFVTAVDKVWPGVLLQFEDFGMDNAWYLLDTYEDSLTTFNDDIQGTAAVVLAGLISARQITGQPYTGQGQTYLFLGAGQAAVGIANLLCQDMVTNEGATWEEAHGRIWMMDSRGLLLTEREKRVKAFQTKYQKPTPAAVLDPKDLYHVIEALKPTVLIGVSTVHGAFTPEIIQLMSRINDKPVIFALSNPTSKSECTAEEAYKYSEGRAVFASGSPFPEYWHGEIHRKPRQANNCYIFPGVGLGVIASGSKRVTQEQMLAASYALASCVSPEDLHVGSLFPSMKNAREASAFVAAAVAKVAFKSGLATVPRPKMSLVKYCASLMYIPDESQWGALQRLLPTEAKQHHQALDDVEDDAPKVESQHEDL